MEIYRCRADTRSMITARRDSHRLISGQSIRRPGFLEGAPPGMWAHCRSSLIQVSRPQRPANPLRYRFIVHHPQEEGRQDNDGDAGNLMSLAEQDMLAPELRPTFSQVPVITGSARGHCR